VTFKAQGFKFLAVMELMELLENYTLVRTLTTSEHSRVELATSNATGEFVAIKVSQKCASSVSEFRREANILRMLQTPGRDRHIEGQSHILRLIEELENEHEIALVLEYCPNGELFDAVQKVGRFSETEARRLFRQLVRALQFMHARGFVHLDVALENVMLDESGGAKLIDFGLARNASFCSKGHRRVGKIPYMAPEIFSGEEFDPNCCDVWSLGVLLFGLVTGRAPFNKPDKSDAWFRTVYGGRLKNTISRQRVFTHLSDSLIDLLSKILTQSYHRLTLEMIWDHPWMREESLSM